MPGGQKIEAHKVLSDGTSGLEIGWGAATQENVTSSLTGSYSSLVVTGQVMTFNDVRASVFWTNNCVTRATGPTPTSFCVGKHIGQINATRNNETLGYIVAEPGTGTVNGVQYAFGLGADSIAGVSNAPHSFAVTGDFETGILQSEGEDGGQGGWAVLYGADPLPNNSVVAAIEEETVAGDTGRSHTNERLYHMLFRDNQTANLVPTKTAAVYDGGFALPGNDVAYSNAAARPTTFGDCTYMPAAGYDAAVRHICFNPKGRLNSGTLHPGATFQFKFRARVD